MIEEAIKWLEQIDLFVGACAALAVGATVALWIWGKVRKL